MLRFPVGTAAGPGPPLPQVAVGSISLVPGHVRVIFPPGHPMTSTHFHLPNSRGPHLDLRCLVRSSQPAVVFTSLAHLCVPAFSDACTVDIIEHDELAYRIAHRPAETADGPVDADGYRAVRAPFTSPPNQGGDERDRYSGVVTYLWRSRQPTPVDVARAAVLARYAVLAVHEERIEQDACGLDDTMLDNTMLDNTTVHDRAAAAGTLPPRPRSRRARPGPRHPMECQIGT